MDNKIKHTSPTQLIPDMEFKPLLRGESPYYGNLNRPSFSAYDLAKTVSEIQSWGGYISILQPFSQTYEFKLYEIAKIADGEVLKVADNDPGRYCIVVAEAEIEPITGIKKNIVVCTFCPNFVFPDLILPELSVGSNLYVDKTTVPPSLSGVDHGSGILAKKTGTQTIFFSGTCSLW